MMTSQPCWLPRLVTLQSFGGDVELYLNELYSIFVRDFVLTRPTFRGMPVGRKRHPISAGKDATFWHLIQEGRTEEKRLPDLRRCERIEWPRAIIEHCEEPEIKVWENTRRRSPRVCLWLEDQEYLVVLALRRSYALLWTAYLTTRGHTKKRLTMEYREYEKSQKG